MSLKYCADHGLRRASARWNQLYGLCCYQMQYSAGLHPLLEIQPPTLVLTSIYLKIIFDHDTTNYHYKMFFLSFEPVRHYVTLSYGVLLLPAPTSSSVIAKTTSDTTCVGIGCHLNADDTKSVSLQPTGNNFIGRVPSYLS